MKMPTADEITQAFNAAEEEFGDRRSTNFLCAIVGDRLGIDYGDVIDGLVEVAQRNPESEIT